MKTEKERERERNRTAFLLSLNRSPEYGMSTIVGQTSSRFCWIGQTEAPCEFKHAKCWTFLFRFLAPANSLELTCCSHAWPLHIYLESVRANDGEAPIVHELLPWLDSRTRNRTVLKGERERERETTVHGTGTI